MFDIIAQSLTTRLPRTAPMAAAPAARPNQTPADGVPVSKEAIQELDQAIKQMVLH